MINIFLITMGRGQKLHKSRMNSELPFLLLYLHCVVSLLCDKLILHRIIKLRRLTSKALKQLIDPRLFRKIKVAISVVVGGDEYKLISESPILQYVEELEFCWNHSQKWT